MSDNNFDEIIHAPNRLKICAFLAPLELAEFKILRDELKVSDSVLSKHIKQLEDIGYVGQRKGSADGRKRTWLYLTPKGRKAFKKHVIELRKLIASVD
jgi:DNA-binding MarR family transcriptional regulator